MKFRVACLWLGFVGCGSSAKSTSDAATGDAQAESDAPHGTLSPDPPDLVGSACAGRLGFPTPPGVITRDAATLQVTDVDGDGHLDFLYANGAEVGIARGDGTGTALPPVLYALDTNSARTARAADMNGDGKLDQLYSAAGLQIRLATGNGVYGAPATFASGGTLARIETVDLDGDGKLDVVGAVADADRIVILLQTATGFTAPESHTLMGPNGTQSLAVRDVNGDGRADIVAPNLGLLYVFLNNGAGGFPAAATYPVATAAGGIALADLDEDGDLDAVVGSANASQAGQLSVLRNQGAAVFGAPAHIALMSATPQLVVAGDFNGDGHVDVAATSRLDRGVRVLVGNGTGSFAVPATIENDRPLTLAVGDVNADGRTDLVTTGELSLATYLGRTGTTPFDAREVYELDMFSERSHGARFLDVTSDGRPDLLWMSATTPTSGIIQMRVATNGVYPAPSVGFSTSAAPYLSTIADVDNDARQDLIIIGGASTSWTVQTMRNEGNGLLAAMPPRNLVGLSAFQMIVADVTGDGFRDLVTGGREATAEVNVYPGLGNGEFGAGTTLWSGASLAGLAVGDVDGDGKLDIVLSSYDGDQYLYFLRGSGTGTFAAPVTSLIGQDGRVHLRDVDGDAKLDIVAFAQAEILVARGAGDGTFAAPISTFIGSPFSRVDAAFADFDGDTHLDIALPTFSGVAVLRGRGDGAFHAPGIYEGENGPRTVSLGDADGDGHIDIMITNLYNRVSVLRGRCL